MVSSCWFTDRTKYLYLWPDWFYQGEKNSSILKSPPLYCPGNSALRTGEGDELFNAQGEFDRLKAYAERSGYAGSLRIKIFPGIHELDKAGVG